MDYKFTEHKGIILVRKIITSWSKVYINQVFLREHEDREWRFEVEFSQPRVIKPIPEGTVRVYITVIDREGQIEPVTYTADDPTEGGRFEFEFSFENESLIHRLDGNTMRTSMFESWINNMLQNKLKVVSELYLGTEFEHTRSVD